MKDEFKKKVDELIDRKSKNHPNKEDIENIRVLMFLKEEKFESPNGSIGEDIFIHNKFPIWNDGSYLMPERCFMNDGTKDVELTWPEGEIKSVDSTTIIAVAPYNLVQEGGAGTPVEISTCVLNFKCDKKEMPILDIDILLREDYDRYLMHESGKDIYVRDQIYKFYCDFYKVPEWSEETQKTAEGISKNFLIQEKFITQLCETFKIDKEKTDIVNYIVDNCITDPHDLFCFYWETHQDQFPEIEENPPAEKAA